MKICSTKELRQIDSERLEEIKKYAIYENSVYFSKNTRKKSTVYEPLNHNCKSKKEPKIIFKQIPNVSTTLENYILYKSNSQKIELKNNIEIMYFICNGIFPDDNKFLNLLIEKDFLNIFDEFVTQYSYIDEKYQDNIKLEMLQKDLQFTKLIKKHNDELIECQKYFYKFHGICRMDIIINKLLHIYCFNQELYNSYKLNNIEKLKLTKKLG